MIMLCVVMLSAAMAQQAMAQPDARDDLKVGVKAGANLSNVWDQRGGDFRADSKMGFAGGVWLGIPIGTYLGFQPEVLLSQKGFRADGTLLGSEYTFRRTTTHLDIPLQLQLKPATFLTIVGGPQYSFLLREANKYTFGSNSVEQQEQFDNDNIRRNMLGFVIGFDVIVHQFVFASRVGWDVLDNHGDGSSSTPRYKNRWIQFAAGIQF
ncbi:MAG: PorT family protein [Cryomorphaceae bacterium]|nr:MAG: PorT family protein [Cryomorphaceae bacterium]